MVKSFSSSIVTSTKFQKINFLLIFLILFSALSTFSTAAEITDGASIVKVYTTSDNSVERRMALNALSDVVVQRGTATPQWVSDLLVKAIDDKSPVVVDAAVYQIGNFGLAGMTEKLISLYSEVEKKFSSAYANRIQYSIVPALGRTGGKEASAFLPQLLAQDKGTVMGQFLLLAIKDLNEFSLVDNVKQYKVKMEGLVKFAKAKKYDPLIYSRKLMYIDLALDVEKSLVSKGGK